MHTGGYQGLPQKGTTPLVHYEVAVAGHTSRAHEYYGTQCGAPFIQTVRSTAYTLKQTIYIRFTKWC